MSARGSRAACVGRPRGPRHARRVGQLRAADRARPGVVWTSDGGGRALALRKPLRGGARVAHAWAALSRRALAEPIEIKLNGRLGLMLPSADGYRGALSFVVKDGRITRIDAVRNPEKLRRL
jgi:RNA polymerase sigma-70 factor (ECF subfamily)